MTFSIPDTGPARHEAAVLLERLNAELLAHDSATLTLERWCAARHLAGAGRIRAELVGGVGKPASAAVRHDLGAGPGEAIRYRRVRLWWGERVLSEADNWYVPRLLSPAMNRRLDQTDMPFGRAVRALNFSRRTLAANLLWQPLAAPGDTSGTVPIPAGILRHRAVLATPDGAAFSVVVETYQRAMLGFALPTRAIGGDRSCLAHGRYQVPGGTDSKES